MLNFLDDVDLEDPSFAEIYDELPLWSAPFGRMLLDRVPLDKNGTILDVGCGTGFSTLELAQRCGPGANVIAVDPWGAGLETDSFRIRFADGSALLRHTLIRVGFLKAWKAIPPLDRVEDTFVDLERRLNEVASRQARSR